MKKIAESFLRPLLVSTLNPLLFFLCFAGWGHSFASSLSPSAANTNVTPAPPAASSSYGAISGGLAGSGLSSNDAGESYILNPGAIAHLRGAAITFGTSQFQSTPNIENGSTVTHDGSHLSLNENSPDSVIATSIFVSKSRSREKKSAATSTLSYNDAWLTFGNFVMPNLSAGLNYHFRDTQDPLKTYQEHNFGIGFLWTPLESLGVGFSFLNFNAAPKEIPTAYTLGSTSGIGLLYIYKEFLRIRLDYSKKDHELESLSYTETALGLETTISEWIYSRVGVAQQKSESNVIHQKQSFGLGFAGPRFGIHYAFQQYQQALKGKEHNLDFIIPF